MPVHTVEQGEHLSSIAAKYGFQKVSTIWEHPDNADLKSRRKNPHILLPGDKVTIPDKQKKVESRGTTRTHSFQLAGEKLKLKLALRDINDKPRSGLKCTLIVENESKPVTSDGDGNITTEIPKTARSGKLVLPDLEIPLLIGHLDPIEEQSGQVARLDNLGYEAGDPANPDKEIFRSAVEEFQCDQKISVTGDCDAATQAKLKSVHGS
jgi:N-acetylmuramoyl-L-alanine amidase